MKKFYKSPLMILALGLIVLGASSVGATRAAIMYQTAAEHVNFSTAVFSVDITGDIADGKLTFPAIENDIEEKGFIDIGKKYPETVKIVNNSNEETGYKEYVRVVVQKSWKNADGKKNQTLDPALIKLEVADGWIINEAESNNNDKYKEQTVYYLKKPLECGQEASFITGITVDNKVTQIVKDATTESTITHEYVYDGQIVDVSIRADAVQTHNAEEAIYAAWGVKATCSAIDDGDIVSITQ